MNPHLVRIIHVNAHVCVMFQIPATCYFMLKLAFFFRLTVFIFIFIIQQQQKHICLSTAHVHQRLWNHRTFSEQLEQMKTWLILPSGTNSYHPHCDPDHNPDLKC